MEMVGMIATSRFREEAISYLNDAKLHTDTSAKTNMLKRLKEILLHRDPSLLNEFIPYLLELQTERSAPMRNYLVQMIQEICLKYPEQISKVAPVLLTLIHDDVPAVARHAISTSSSLFRITFEQVALQGIYSGQLDAKLQESWEWMTTLKDAMYSASKEHKNDGVRLLAIKFIEMVILLFTPEPNGSTQPPPVPQKSEKTAFNVAWLHGGHPVLDVGSLGQEASRNLSLLLDQLRGTEVLKIPGPVAVVLVNSLASIGKQRPSLYGRVLPVLLGLVPNWEVIKGVQATSSIAQALKNAFLNLLKCTHSGAGPWRERVVSALKRMKEGDAAEPIVNQAKAEKLQAVDRARPTQENGIMDEHPGKRARLSPAQADSREGKSGCGMENYGGSVDAELDTDLSKALDSIRTLLAKGEEAVTSVDCYIARISAEVLADVVIENMKNLPHLPPAVSPRATSETKSGLPFNLGVPFSAVDTLEQSLVSSFSGQSFASSIHPPELVPITSDHRRDPRRDPRRVELHHMDLSADVKLEESVVDVPNSSSTDTIVHMGEESFSTPSADEQMSFIPGISQTHVSKETKDISIDGPVNTVGMSLVTASEAPQIHNVAISLPNLTGPSSPQPISSPLHNSVQQVDAIDEVKPLVSIAVESVPSSVAVVGLKDEVQGVALSGATFQCASTPVPVVFLNTDEQIVLWKVLLQRILGSHKQVASSGGNELRFTLLARFLLGSDADDEVWEILLTHILADYQNHRGHDLVLHTLYHLYADQRSPKGESNGGALTPFAYEKFFLSVAEGLRDTLPPTDKSLSKLLGEAPVLPMTALELLEGLCNPRVKIKDGLEAPVVERITQGLSAVWSLILMRPPVRSECLHIALKCTVHELEEVRTKAIRLVANKLYPLNYISQSIEDYAMKMLHTVLDMGNHDLNGTVDSPANDVLELQDSKADQVTDRGPNSRTSVSDQYVANENSGEEEEHKNGKILVSVHEAQRCMSLYFALCTKKHSLLREIFDIYERSPKAVKQAVHKHMPVLIRTIGSSSLDVLQIISNPPAGSKNLIFLVLHVLTELSAPPPELIAAVKQLYESRIKDAKLLVPILSSLSKEEVLPIFPRLVALPAPDFKGALDRILQGSVHTGPALTPAEVLIAIHGIDPERDHVPLSMVKDACAVCFQQRTVFTQQVLAKVLNQLVEQTPLPMLFMRTVIQAVGSFRSLVSFVMEILSRLVSKQIWKWPNLWIGFLKCAEQTQPHSFHVLLQLPALHLEKALIRHPNIRVPLTKHASKPAVRSTLPRSTLLVLELAQDVVPSETVQSTPADVSTPASNPDAETQVSESAKTGHLA
ncbi:hypothetical protein GOP47_0006955 [Adiantum capillus-veneris]|uniref:Symplekin n=1 Tax=Adiantum capillus-veneris TaxID=13818 RepID=A0A9D4UZQ5_ADICA|nr:hypothetical protein GOP47_0006955 [Adiantum capillus-veneris]